MPLRKDVHFKNLTFASLQTDAEDLPKNLPLVGLNLHVTGNVDLTNVTAVSLSDEGILNVITSIVIRGDGKDLQKWTGRSLFAYNWYMNGGINNHILQPLLTAAVHPIEFHLYLPFEFLPRRITGFPGVSYLDASGFDKFEIEIGFGSDDASADVYTTLTAGTIQDMNVRVDAVVLNEKARNIGLPRKILRTVPIVHAPAAANEAEPIPLNRNGSTAFVMIRVSDAATGHILSDALCNFAGIRQGADFFLTGMKSWDFLQSQQQRYFQLANDYTPGTPGQLRIEGHVMMPLIQDGEQDAFSPGFGTEFAAIVDTDAAARYDIQQIRLEQAPASQQG